MKKDFQKIQYFVMFCLGMMSLKYVIFHPLEGIISISAYCLIAAGMLYFAKREEKRITEMVNDVFKEVQKKTDPKQYEGKLWVCQNPDNTVTLPMDLNEANEYKRTHPDARVILRI